LQQTINSFGLDEYHANYGTAYIDKNVTMLTTVFLFKNLGKISGGAPVIFVGGDSSGGPGAKPR